MGLAVGAYAKPKPDPPPLTVKIGSAATYDSRCGDAYRAVRWYRGRYNVHRTTLGFSLAPPVEQAASCRRLRERAIYWIAAAQVNRLEAERVVAERNRIPVSRRRGGHQKERIEDPPEAAQLDFDRPGVVRTGAEEIGRLSSARLRFIPVLDMTFIHIIRAAAIPNWDVQITVRPEADLSAIMIHLRVIDFQQHSL